MTGLARGGPVRRRAVLKAGAAGPATLAAMRYLGSPPSEGPLFVRRMGSESGPANGGRGRPPPVTLPVAAPGGEPW